MSAAAGFWIFYCLPGIIALLRSHRHAALIVMVNLLTGWTIVGWFVCLLWAFTNTGRVHHPAH
ncbi:MAG: superinfection immunity protein [Gammaproteobacteria bacterium]